MDLSKLRDAALKHGEDEEAVTVDTRALIDKVLARYSGEWTTLRELIQNAADAQATTVKIKWETYPSTTVPQPATTDRSELLKHVITNHTLRRLLVQNNGQPFTKTDWSRLKRIAEGNPDETKIGAFGVGFYSVFADCEEPFVSSGNEAMAFYWKGNALFTRKLMLPEGQGGPDTTFMLDYRNSTTALPNLLSIGQFLAASLTFVALQSIEFWIDDYMILGLKKKTSPSENVPLPRDLDTSTKEGHMRLTSVERVSTQIDATVMHAIGWKPKPSSLTAKLTETYGLTQIEPSSLKSFFSRFTSSGSSSSSHRVKQAKEEKESSADSGPTLDLTSTSTSSIFLRTSTAVVTTRIPTSSASELERATKKPPPKTTKLSILTSSYDETMASQSSVEASSRSAADVFASVLPSKKPGGRIFIGFPTTQTTGGGMHISAPSVIPTVEREAIDLNARCVCTWNIEMLRVAGIMSRLAFSLEMSDLQAKMLQAVTGAGRSSISPADIEKFAPEALHILNTYTFKDTTPSNLVGGIIEDSFWTAFKRASIEIYSSRGVLPSSKVRRGSDELAKFVDGIPIIIEQMEDSPFVRKLEGFGLIVPITSEDIRKELGEKALNKDQLINFLTWASKTADAGQLNNSSRRGLLDVAIATVSDSGSDNQGEIIALSTIKNYLGTGKIPANMPVPPTTLPYSITASIPQNHLQALGWEPLEIVPWLGFLISSAASLGEEQNLTTSSKFAGQVLLVLSKNWDNMNQTSKNQVVATLKDVTVMPTKLGMKKPAEAFFPTVKLFDDLPIIQGCQNVKERFLVAMGVRKTLDLETIFTRLLTPQKEGTVRWSHMELIKYLASVRDDIPPEDMKRLRESRICPAEAGPAGLEPTKGTTQLYKVSELYEPNSHLRALRLPLLQWPGPPGSFRLASHEGRFLSSLGLRPYPTVPELVDMMASQDQPLRTNAMSYFIANHHINNYAHFNIGSTQKAILPLQGAEKELVAPSACYTDDGAAVLGFNVLAEGLQIHASKFGVARDPPMVECVNRLIANPPQTHKRASELFLYFATRLGDLVESNLARLRDTAFVPVTRTTRAGSKETATSVVLVKPQNCYLGTSSTYNDIFDFVDFGLNANAFLFKCGAKSEPTKVEIARMACNEPARLLGILQSPEKYLNLLRSLADAVDTLKRDRELFAKMRTSPFLLGSKEISSGQDGDARADDDDDAPIKQYQLATPSQIVILDDYISYRLFKKSLVVAPEEDLLEGFYMKLGSRLLGDLVQEDLRVGPLTPKQDGAQRLRKHVLERSKLFLYEYSKNSTIAIKHDIKWLEKNLQVESVRAVALRRSLRGRPGFTHTEQRSASSVQNGRSFVLYVSAEGPPDMYQVGQALCQQLLERPNPQAYGFFEPFLKLDLLQLRARGYNVDRILRAKAAEARIAEEERRKAQEEEQRRIKELEQEWGRQGAVAAAARQERSRTPDPIMPGSFGNDSPPSPDPPQPNLLPPAKSKGLFSNLTRRLGFDRDGESSRHLHDFLHPEQQHLQNGVGSPAAIGDGSDQQQQEKQRMDDGRVTSPAVVQQNLLNAINSTRAHDSSTLFSPPKTTEVKEQATYCDSNAEQDLCFAAEAPRGMRVFIAKNMTAEQTQGESSGSGSGSGSGSAAAAAAAAGKFLAVHGRDIAAFETLLRDVAGVYGLSPSAMHIFYDEAGGTIAFNIKGSVFCNLRFFVQLHASRMATGASRVEATTWWWVVVAHELAHNLVQVHNSDHSYYTESFIQQFMGKLMAKAATLAPNGGGAGPSTPTLQAPLQPAPAASTGGVLPRQETLPPPYSRQAPPSSRHLLD